MKLNKIRKILLTLFSAAFLSAVLTFSSSALEYVDNGKLKVGLEFGSTSPSVTEFTSASGFRVVSFNEETYESVPLFETAQTKITVKNGGNIGIIYNESGTEIYRSTTQAMYITGISGSMDYKGKTYMEVMKLFFKDGLMRVINIVEFETYLKGVLPREVYPSWPDEALRAAAVAARTYAFYSLGGKHSKYDVDICTTTCCQVYGGNGKNEAASTNAAVEATRNQVLAYNGELAMTVYTATAGDHTESSSGAWGSDQSKYPYLCGVPTPFETPEEYANGSWSNTYTAAEIFEYINSKAAYAGKLVGGISSISVEHAENGYARKITVTDIYGNSVTAKNSGSVRGMLSKFAKSAKFTITPNYYEPGASVYVLTSEGLVKSAAVPYGYTILRGGNATPEVLMPQSAPYSYTITGTGWGHGVGMSQNGAMTLAKLGKTYTEILAIYYPGTYITTLSVLSGKVAEPTIPSETEITTVPIIPTAPPVPEAPNQDIPQVTTNPLQNLPGVTVVDNPTSQYPYPGM